MKNRARILISLLSITFIFLWANSCALWKYNKISLTTNKILSQRIVSEKLANWAKYGKVYVDSLLLERSTIFNRDEFVDAHKLLPDLLLPKKVEPVFPYEIPDSLSSNLGYIDSEIDIENGPETGFFFSPLLRTKVKEVFVMQVYLCQTIYVDDSIPYRFASRNFDLYRLRKGQIKFIKTISADEDLFSLPFPRLH
jgi:hypothetical protein